MTKFKNPTIDQEGPRSEPAICDRCGEAVAPAEVKAHELTAGCIRRMFEKAMPGAEVEVAVKKLPHDQVRVSVRAKFTDCVEVTIDTKEGKCRQPKRCTK